MATFPGVRSVFATGTGTDETALQTLTVPSGANYLSKVRGHVHATQGDPAESIIGIFRIKGQDWRHNPYEFYSEIGSAKLGAVDQVGYHVKPTWWDCGLPTRPGSTIAVTYEPCDALANNGEAAVDQIWSDVKPPGPQVQRLCTVETASTTAVGPTSTLVGAKRIVAVGGFYTAATVAADDPSVARLTLTCNALRDIQSLEWHYNFIHTIEATSGIAVTSLTQIEGLDLAVKDVGGDPAIFTSRITVDTALTTAAAYGYYVEYEPRSVSLP